MNRKRETDVCNVSGIIYLLSQIIARQRDGRMHLVITVLKYRNTRVVVKEITRRVVSASQIINSTARACIRFATLQVPFL